MPINRKQQRLARAKARTEDIPYAWALQSVRDKGTAPSDIEPHYLFVPPYQLYRVTAAGRAELPLPPENAFPGSTSFSWGYHGSGPLTTATALLLDATGDADHDLAIGFVSDNLAWGEEIGDRLFILTVAEVCAWRAEREAAIREEAAAEPDTWRRMSRPWWNFGRPTID